MRSVNSNSKQQTELPAHIKKRVDEVRSTGFWALGLGISGALLIVIGIWLFGRYPNLGTLLVVAGALAMTAGTSLLLSWLIGRIPLYTFRKSWANRERIEKLIAAGLPYGFYIRDFSPESESVFHFNPIGGSSYSYDDPVESSLVRELSNFIPFFALMNVSDHHESPAAARIYCEDKDWFEAFKHYAGNASLMIVNVDKVTPNVRRELDWAFHSNRKCRVLIVSTFMGLADMRSEYARIEEKSWLVSRTSRKSKEFSPPSNRVSVPGEVKLFVRSLLVPQVEEMRLQFCRKLNDGRCLLLLMAVCRARYGGTVTIVKDDCYDEKSDGLQIPPAESLQTSGGRYYLVIEIRLHLDPDAEKIRKSLQSIKFRIRGPSSAAGVQVTINLGDWLEFDQQFAQVVGALRDVVNHGGGIRFEHISGS